MPDSGASGISTAGRSQVQALKALQPGLQIDKSTARRHKIKFGTGEALSEGTVTVDTPLGKIEFHVVPAETPFLLCIQDMDRMGVKLDNLENVLIQGKTVVPVTRKWGHPWMLLGKQASEEAISFCHLTEGELRQLHRRFGHPSVQKLASILERSGNDVEMEALKHLTKVCHQCQIHSKAPNRFKFAVRKDVEFNSTVIIDILWIDGEPTLQAVCEGTAFSAARFLAGMSAKEVWEALRMCWIDVYLGPMELLVTDAGTNIACEEFRQQASLLHIEVKEVPVEAHHSIGKVEKYHVPLRRIYNIFKSELPA